MSSESLLPENLATTSSDPMQSPSEEDEIPVERLYFFRICCMFVDEIPRVLRCLLKKYIKEKFEQNDEKKALEKFKNHEYYHKRQDYNIKSSFADGNIEEWEITLLSFALLYSSHLILAKKGTYKAILKEKWMIILDESKDKLTAFEKGKTILMDGLETLETNAVQEVYQNKIKLHHEAKKIKVNEHVRIFLCCERWKHVNSLRHLRNVYYAHSKSTCLEKYIYDKVVKDIEASFRGLGVTDLDSNMKKILKEDYRIQPNFGEKLEELKERFKKDRCLEESLKDLVLDVKETVQDTHDDVKAIKRGQEGQMELLKSIQGRMEKLKASPQRMEGRKRGRSHSGSFYEELSCGQQQQKRSRVESVDVPQTLARMNFIFIYDEYRKLLLSVIEYLEKLEYKFEDFVKVAEFGPYHFPSGFYKGEKKIRDYLNMALEKEVLYPLDLFNHKTDALHGTLFVIFSCNKHIYNFYRKYEFQLIKYSKFDDVLERFKTEDGQFVLCLPQFEEIKHKDKDEVTLRINKPLELKGGPLQHFKKIWNSFQRMHPELLAPAKEVLKWISEGNSFDITWLISPEISHPLCMRVPFSHNYFYTESITRVWIKGELIYHEDIHGLQDVAKAQVQLLQTCACGRHMELQALLKVLPGLDLDLPDENSGRTALMLAAHNGHLDIADTLIEKKASVNVQEKKSGWSALVFAADGGHKNLVELLLEHGANILVHDENGTLLLDLLDSMTTTPSVNSVIGEVTMLNIEFLDACEEGKIDEVLDIIHQPYININIMRPISGETALFYAAKGGHNELVNILLSHEADVLISNCQGLIPLDTLKDIQSNTYKWLSQTTLIAAARKNNFELVKKIVGLGVHPNTFEIDKNHYSALLLACQNGSSDIVNFLLERGADAKHKTTSNWTGITLASHGGYKEIVNILLSKGVEIDTKTDNEWTALLFAASKNYTDLAKLLLDKGANLKASDKNGFTPLVQASQNGYLDMVKLLLERDPQLWKHQTDNPSGWTALMWATRNEHKEVVHYLIEKGADMYQHSKYEINILHIASSNGHKSLVKYFCDKGMDVDVQDQAGLTPLMYAAKQGHLEIAEILIENGAKVNLADKIFKWTPAFYALQCKQQNIFKCLIQTGKVDIQYTDKNENTIYMLFKEAFQYLMECPPPISSQIKTREYPKSMEEIESDLEIQTRMDGFIKRTNKFIEVR